jgi:hypothetical protein
MGIIVAWLMPILEFVKIKHDLGLEQYRGHHVDTQFQGDPADETHEELADVFGYQEYTYEWARNKGASDKAMRYLREFYSLMKQAFETFRLFHAEVEGYKPNLRWTKNEEIRSEHGAPQ